jgi:trk system potassium uptake protein TrkH
LVLTLRFRFGYEYDWAAAAYRGVFHAVSAFNNAGFALWPDSLERFATDPWVCLPVAGAIIIGGLGFPVLMELRRRWRRPRSWSLHTRMTVAGRAALLPVGMLAVLAVEWTNPATLGPLSWPARLLAAFFHSANTRTAGFNSVPVGDLHHETLLAGDVLMFIGGGNGGTAGGIKVTTFLLLAYVLWAELRREGQVSAGHRTIPADVQRQALTVALLAVAVVVGSMWLMLLLTPFSFESVAFEVISAFATVGLSTGITAQLPPAGQVLLTVLMFVGRLGPLTLGAALALRSRPQRFRYPPERPIVG